MIVNYEWRRLKWKWMGNLFIWFTQIIRLSTLPSDRNRSVRKLAVNSNSFRVVCAPMLFPYHCLAFTSLGCRNVGHSKVRNQKEISFWGKKKKKKKCHWYKSRSGHNGQYEWRHDCVQVRIMSELRAHRRQPSVKIITEEMSLCKIVLKRIACHPREN